MTQQWVTMNEPFTYEKCLKNVCDHPSTNKILVIVLYLVPILIFSITNIVVGSINIDINCSKIINFPVWILVLGIFTALYFIVGLYLLLRNLKRYIMLTVLYLLYIIVSWLVFVIAHMMSPPNDRTCMKHDWNIYDTVVIDLVIMFTLIFITIALIKILNKNIQSNEYAIMEESV